MTDKSMKIKGYRDLTQIELHHINRIKDMGVEIGILIDGLRSAEENYWEISPTERWLSIGETHMQEGLMALTRAIAKPDCF